MESIEQFEQHGYVDFGSIVPAKACDDLRCAIASTRNFGPELFMSEQDFERLQPNAFNKNPRPGCNLLDQLADLAQPVSEAPALTEFLQELLGPGYKVLRQKLVCGMPHSWMPEWIHKKTKGRPSNNLAHFVKPEFTDITYFYGIDYHQDLVDWKEREPDLVTIYVYIDDVTERKSPLFLLPNTYEAGAHPFPHDLALIDQDRGIWRYRPTGEEPLIRQQKVLARPKGSMFAWHSLTLHGTQPTTAHEPRISLRYLMARDPNARHCALDRINKRIKGPRRLSQPRVDLDARGLAVVEKNALYEQLNHESARN